MLTTHVEDARQPGVPSANRREHHRDRDISLQAYAREAGLTQPPRRLMHPIFVCRLIEPPGATRTRIVYLSPAGPGTAAA